MKANNIIFAFLLTLVTYAGYAQNLNESLTVEGRYTPEVISAERLTVTPSVITIKSPESNLDYDLFGTPANFAPDALSMPATAWRAAKVSDTSRGYLNFRLGSWLNSSLSAGYAAINDEATRLNVRLQHNSTSLWQAWKETELPADGYRNGAAKRFRYDETIGADLCQRIAGAGNMYANLQYHLGYFNYYASEYGIADGKESSSDKKIKAPTQSLNDVYFQIGWKGEPSGSLKYGIDANLRYFGYQNSYTHPDFIHVVEYVKGQGNKETVLNAGGNVLYSFSKGHRLGADILYSGVFNTIGNNVNRVKLAPRYEYSRGNMSLRIGAELAIVGAEKTKLRISPDVRFSIRSGITAFSVKIGGGTHLRTMSYLHQMDYYGNPMAGCHNAAYSPIDASLALQFNPGGRWHFGIESLWRTTLDESFGGVYQQYLNWKCSEPLPAGQTRIQGFSVGINAGYDFCRYFGLNGKANWQPQHGKRGVLNGFDRPAVTATLSALSHPTDALSISLDYNLRAKRYLLKGNISRLNLTADYRINEKLSVGAELCNLLNRHEMLLPDLPSEGLTVNAGFQIIF